VTCSNLYLFDLCFLSYQFEPQYGLPRTSEYWYTANTTDWGLTLRSFGRCHQPIMTSTHPGAAWQWGFQAFKTNCPQEKISCFWSEQAVSWVDRLSAGLMEFGWIFSCCAWQGASNYKYTTLTAPTTMPYSGCVASFVRGSGLQLFCLSMDSQDIASSQCSKSFCCSILLSFVLKLDGQLCCNLTSHLSIAGWCPSCWGRHVHLTLTYSHLHLSYT